MLVVGKIKFFNMKKGFGFITPEANSGTGEAFVHIKDIKDRTIAERASQSGGTVRVEYEEIEGTKGLQAKDVKEAQ